MTDTSNKIRDLKVLLALPTTTPPATSTPTTAPDDVVPTGKGKHRNPEQDIAGYLLNLYFLSKYKFFSDRGFTEYKQNMRYFRTLGDYSGPFLDLYKELLGDKATEQRLKAFEQAGKLARSLSYRPVLLKTAFRPLRTLATKVPYPRLKQFVRSISHYFEHGSVPDAALEKAMMEEVRPVIKHYRMKKMLKDISENIDELVKAGNLFEEEKAEEPGESTSPEEQVAAKVAPPKPHILTVEELKQMSKMELFNVLRETKDEKDYEKILEATEDKAVLAYMVNVKAYFSDTSLAALKNARVLKRAWVSKLRPAAKLAFIKAHDFNSGNRRDLPDYWFAVKILNDATPEVLEAWLKAKFRYENNSTRGTVKDNTVKELDHLFKQNPELLTKNIIDLLLKNDMFKSVTLSRWMPDSIAMDMKETNDPDVLISIINRSKPADAVKLLQDNISKFPGRLIDLKKHVPAKWRLIASIRPGTYGSWWRVFKSTTCAAFLSDKELCSEFKEQAKTLVSSLQTTASTAYESIIFKKIYVEFPKIRSAMIRFGSKVQISSLDPEDRDEEALESIRGFEKEKLAQQQAWFSQNWNAQKSATASFNEFEQAAYNAPTSELPSIYDAAMNRMPSAVIIRIFGRRMPDEYCVKFATSTDVSDSERVKYAERVRKFRF